MLRPAGGFGGGDRPPVNIEINFVTGSGDNAFVKARADLKALRADLDDFNRHATAMGLGGVGGGTATGGGVAGTARAAAPGFVVGRGSRFSASDASREASETVWATNRVVEANRALAQSARDVATAYIAMNTASQVAGSIQFGGGGGTGGVASSAGMSSIERMLVNAQRRRQGLGPLTDPTIAAAAAAAAAGGGGMSGGGAVASFIASPAAVPAAIVAAVAGVAASRTPQGVDAIGGYGSWLEGVTREEGFAQQFLKSLGGLTGADITGRGNWRNPVQWYRDTMLGPYVEQAQTGERVNRMLADQQARNATYQLGQLSALSSTGFGLDPLAAAQAQNRLRVSQLQDQFGRASFSFDQRYEAGEALKQAALEQLNLKRQELAVQQGILETAKRQKDVVDAQVAGLAGMSNADLRRAERAYQSSLDGTVTSREAEILRRAGMGDLQAVRDFNLSRSRDLAPSLTSYVTRDMSKIQAEMQKSNAEIEKLTAEIGQAASDTQKSATGMVAEVLELFKTIDSELTTLRQEMEIERRNAGVKNGQGAKAPGIRGPGQAR